jgi:hypothetical protein
MLGNEPSLPGFELPGSRWVGQPSEFVVAVRENTGLDVDLLRSVHEDLDEPKTKSVTILFAARPGTHLSDSMAWASAADVSSLATDQSEVAELVAGILTDLGAGVTNEHMPWTDRGWHLEAEDWLRAACSLAGTPVTAARLHIRPRRTSSGCWPPAASIGVWTGSLTRRSTGRHGSICRAGCQPTRSRTSVPPASAWPGCAPSWRPCAWQLAQPLTALNHAISYVSLWSAIDPQAADREFGGSTARWLHSLVDALRRNG